MIAIDSTGYPCLAVIQHFNIPEEKHKFVYDLGRQHLEAWMVPSSGPSRLNNLPSMDHIVEIGADACAQLWQNYYYTAKEHKWGPFNEY